MSSIMAALPQMIAETHEFLTCILAGETDQESDQFHFIVQTRLDELLTEIDCVAALSVRDSTQCIASINQGPFPKSMQAQLIARISAKTSSGIRNRPSTSGHTSRKQLQTHLYLSSYLTSDDWATLRSMKLISILRSSASSTGAVC